MAHIMLHIAETYRINGRLEGARGHFLEQVRLLLPLDALTVVLLDPDKASSRIAFS